MISDFGAACLYLTMVDNCTVAGEGVGAQRTLASADGSAIIERLETLDAASQWLSYALLIEAPFVNCLNSLALRELGPHPVERAWSATFPPD